MARSLKKGPFADAYLLKKVDRGSQGWKQVGYKDLVTPLDYIPTDGWSYNCSI